MKFLIQITHYLSFILFLGSIIITLVLKIHSERNKSNILISYSLKTAILLDKLITVPAAILITISGITLIWINGLMFLQYIWLQISIILWLCSASVATLYLVPKLKKLFLIAEKQVGEGEITLSYYEQARKWNVVSMCLIISPIIVLILMILKPLN